MTNTQGTKLRNGFYCALHIYICMHAGKISHHMRMCASENLEIELSIGPR